METEGINHNQYTYFIQFRQWEIRAKLNILFACMQTAKALSLEQLFMHLWRQSQAKARWASRVIINSNTNEPRNLTSSWTLIQAMRNLLSTQEQQTSFNHLTTVTGCSCKLQLYCSINYIKLMLNPKQKQELKWVLKIKWAAVSAHNSSIISSLQVK